MTVSCEDIRNLALLAACGEASRADEASVGEHAAQCPACAAEIASLREGLELLRHAPRETPSRETRAAIGGILLRHSARTAGGSPGVKVRLWAAAAAALLALTAGVLMWRGHTAPAGGNPPVAGISSEKPAPAPLPKVVPAPVDDAIAWEPSAHSDIESLAQEVADLRTSKTPTATETASLWFTTDPSADTLNSLYDDLDALSSSAEKF